MKLEFVSKESASVELVVLTPCRSLMAAVITICSAVGNLVSAMRAYIARIFW